MEGGQQQIKSTLDEVIRVRNGIIRIKMPFISGDRESNRLEPNDQVLL
jgi:hypothetical protein